jgi:hypothetical protein
MEESWGEVRKDGKDFYNDMTPTNETEDDEAAELMQEATEVTMVGMQKYSTLGELQGAQRDLAQIVVAHPRLRPTVETLLDKRALQIIENKLRTFKDAIELENLMIEVKAFPFYKSESERDAYARILEAGKGVHYI